MAIVYPNANGNWSTVANWLTTGGGAYGMLPQSGDDVYLNNKTLTIDLDVIVVSINNASGTGITAGGIVNISMNVTVTANINLTVSTTVSPSINITNIGITNIIGLITTTYTYNSTSNGIILFDSEGTLNISSNILHNSGGLGLYAGQCIRNNRGGTINFTGWVSSLGHVGAYGIVNGSSGIINHTGISKGNGIYNNIGTVNVLAGYGSAEGIRYAYINASTGIINFSTQQTQNGVYVSCLNNSSGIVNYLAGIIGSLASAPSLSSVCSNQGAGSVYVTGDVIAREVAYSATVGLINNSSTGVINVSGNVQGGSVLNSIAISNTGNGTVNIGGNAIGGSASNTPAILANTAAATCTHNISGNTIAGTYPAIYSISTLAKNILIGNIVNTSKVQAIVSMTLEVSEALDQVIILQETVGNTNRSFSTSSLLGQANELDVRKDTVFGAIGEFKGLLAVSPPSQVVKGVPTDNTVGTWAFDNELITRLEQCSTVPITGQQIASYNGAPVSIIPNAEKRFDVSGTTSYYGTAVQGTLESSPTWNLTKIITAVDGTTTTTHAIDSWDNHLTATYL